MLMQADTWKEKGTEWFRGHYIIIVGKCWLFNSDGFRNWAATHQPAGAEGRINDLFVPAALSQERCCIVSFNWLISPDRFLQRQNF